MENIYVPISPGELIDKITILEIKVDRIKDNNKLKNVKSELELLNTVLEQSELDIKTVQHLKNDLKKYNIELWEIEDKIRIKESSQEFDKEFTELARSVYMQNDKRAATKKEINILLGSQIVEEKSYAEY